MYRHRGSKKTSEKEESFLPLKSFPLIWCIYRNVSQMLKIAQIMEDGLKGDKWLDWKGKFILLLNTWNTNACKTCQKAIFILSEINQSFSHHSLSSWMSQRVTQVVGEILFRIFVPTIVRLSWSCENILQCNLIISGFIGERLFLGNTWLLGFKGNCFFL